MERSGTPHTDKHFWSRVPNHVVPPVRIRFRRGPEAGADVMMPSWNPRNRNIFRHIRVKNEIAAHINVSDIAGDGSQAKFLTYLIDGPSVLPENAGAKKQK